MRETASTPERPPMATSDDLVLSAMDRPVAKRVFTPGRVLLAVGTPLFVVAAVYGFGLFGQTRVTEVGFERITVSPVTRGTFVEYILVAGNIVPRTTVFLDAVDGGQITAVHAEAGDIVSRGQSLVVLKNTKLQLEVIGREAQLTEQLNNLSATSLAFEQNRLAHRRELIDIDHRIDSLSRELARLRPLTVTGAAAQSDLTDLQADLKYQEALRAAVVEAQRVDTEFQSAQKVALRDAIAAMTENLSIARENLDNLVITAPVSGRLTMLEAHVGETRAPGQRIGQIDELDAFKVSAVIDEYYLSRVAVGQIATVEVSGEHYDLEIVKIYPDVRNRQFEVDLRFTGKAPERVRRGQSVRLNLEIGQPADTLMIRHGAFLTDTGGSWAFVMNTEGSIAKRRNVRLGRRNPDNIEVLHGLDAGDRIITSSYERFMEFDAVHVVPSADNHDF